MASQLQSYQSANSLFEPFQSEFLPSHSTETALIKVTTDLLVSVDTGTLSILLLLDLSAVFAMVSDSILLSSLHNLGIRGAALDWFKSYLTDRKQFVTLGDYTYFVIQGTH